MIKAFIYKLLARRHFWRDATFSEVADLYASRTLHKAAVYIGSGFTSVFMYKTGYSLVFIMSFWALIYLGKAILSPIAGLMVARIGTAYGTLISNLIYIPAMLSLSLVPDLGLSAIIVYAVCVGVSGTLYEMCYLIEFSRVKNVLHAGREIGFMNILEKLTITISPVIGGFIALIFGVKVIMWVASVLFALSAVPLFLASSKAEVRQKITVRGFPWRIAISSIIARASMGFDVITTSTVWGLFVAISIFPNSNDDIYVIIGALSSMTFLVAMGASVLYGKIIDKNKGGYLLKIGVGSNSLVHLSRIFTATPMGVVGVNVVNEAATTAQTMAFMRGMFDIADISGHRIMYLMGIDFMNNIGALLACLAMIACEVIFGGITGFRVFFAISAIVVLGAGTARFPVYRR